jgi:HupE/UreJ protein
VICGVLHRHDPSRVVEPLIAASIVFVAVQNIFWPGQSHGRSRLAVAFFFGLFHGLGFAGGLLEIMHQTPHAMILLAILGFSLGVEAGNQIVLLPLFAFLKAVRRSRWRHRPGQHVSIAVQRIGSAAVSVAGVYYLCMARVGAS